jgi:hypothetical protein
MATFWPDGLCSAELFLVSGCGAGSTSFHVPDDSVCALSDDVLDVILLRDVERDFPGATAPSRCAGHGGGCEGGLCWSWGFVSMGAAAQSPAVGGCGGCFEGVCR